MYLPNCNNHPMNQPSTTVQDTHSSSESDSGSETDEYLKRVKDVDEIMCSVLIGDDYYSSSSDDNMDTL